MSVSLKDPSLFIQKGYINGEWISHSSSGKTFEVSNPSTDEKIATLPDMSLIEVTAASHAAHLAFKEFQKLSPRSRSKIVRRWGELMVEHADDLGILTTLENGKPYMESKSEALYAATFLDFYSGEAERQYGDIIPSSTHAGTRLVVIKQPLGVVACLCPWNLPAAMVTRKAGAAIAAGCAVVLKPAGETALTALAIALLGERAGIPKGILNVLTTMGNLAEVGKALCEEPLIQKLSFTGSTRVGRLLMSQSAGSLKKLSLELGGNAAFIVFEDADLSKAAVGLITAKIRASGQSCIAANRVFVQRSIYESFSKLVVEKFQGLKVGEGFEEGVTVGPLTVSQGIQKAERHIEDAVRKGAKVLYGGKMIRRKGNFFEPTVLADMTTAMLSHEEETFAPVVQLYPFDNEEQVIEMANNTDAGLGSYVFTENIGRMWRVAEALQAGMVGVNAPELAASEAPFSGVKASGFGTEGGKYGVEEFMVRKLILTAVPHSVTAHGL